MEEALLDQLKARRDQHQSLQSAASPETPSIPDRRSMGFSERFEERKAHRRQLAHNIVDATKAGEQGWAQAALQLTGQVGAGVVLDAIGEGITTAFRLTPDFIENPIRGGAAWAAHSFLNTDIGQKGMEAAMNGADKWQEFAQENPRSARNISAVVNLGLLFGPVKGKVNPTAPSALGRAGDRVIASGARQAHRNKTEFIERLVRPQTTLKALEREVPRTREVGRGVFRRNVVTLSPEDQAAAAAVRTVKGISTESRTIQGSYDRISSAVRQEADALLSRLSQRSIPIAQSEIDDVLATASRTLGADTLLVGDSARVASRIVEQAAKIAAEHPATAAGLLRTRRGLDAWLRRQKPKIFDAAKEDATNTAARTIRNSLNRLIEEKAGPGVRTSLNRQRSLLHAMDNIAPKAAREGNTVITRAWQNMLSLLPIRGEFNQTMATIFGVGGLGASARFAPIFTQAVTLGLFTYVGGRAVMSPATRRGLGMMLKQMDELIGNGTANPAAVRRLRADRAAIVELIRTSEVSDEPSDELTDPQP